MKTFITEDLSTYIITKDVVNDIIDTSTQEELPHVVGKMLVEIYENFTDIVLENTYNRYRIGFTSFDRQAGPKTARYYLHHGTLENWQVELWTKKNDMGNCRISKYWRQLDTIARRKVMRDDLERILQSVEIDDVLFDASEIDCEDTRNFDADIPVFGITEDDIEDYEFVKMVEEHYNTSCSKFLGFFVDGDKITAKISVSIK